MLASLFSSMLKSFIAYLWRWFKAAFKPAADFVGGISLVLGAIIWAWHKYRPGSFKSAADTLGISPEAAMSDLVWQIPLWAGAAVFLWRLLRAPYEIHVTTEKANAVAYRVLAEKVQGFPRIEVALDGFHRDPTYFCEIAIMGGNQQVVSSTRFECLRLRLVNNPLNPGDGSEAHGVSATVDFYDAYGKNKLITMDGRWADSPQEIHRDKSQDYVSTVLAVTFPVGRGRDLDLVTKHPDED